MAVLGLQLVFSLIMFTFLHKLAPYYSFGRWLLSKRLYRYLHPTNDELKQFVSGAANNGKQSNTGKGRKRGDQRKNNTSSDKAEPFTIPKNLPIQLDQAPVENLDLIQLQYYADYIWMIDFSMCAVIIYILTEIYFLFAKHRAEFNLSVMWCLLVLIFSIRLLGSQAWIYLKTQEGGERVLLITFTFFFLVFAMGVLVVGDNVIELGIEEGYKNFSDNAKAFLKHQGVENSGPMSFLTLRIVLAFIGTLIGGLLTFPGLRFSKLHLDTLKYSQGRRLLSFLLQINYALPLVLILLWIKPVGRDMLCGKSFTVRKQVFYENQFEGFRLIFIVVMCFIKLCLMPTFMQSHLNMAHEKVESLKKEAGRISNVDLQKMVARVFYYLCVVAIQYITPVILILFLTFLLKTLGGLSWVSLFGDSAVLFVDGLPKFGTSRAAVQGGNSTMETLLQSAAHLTSTLGEVRGVFSPLWYRAIFSYLLWWTTTSWFVSTSLGIMYYSQGS